MKNYRKLIGIIIAIAIVVIGTSEPAKNLYKATGLISNGIKVDGKKKEINNQK